MRPPLEFFFLRPEGAAGTLRRYGRPFRAEGGVGVTFPGLTPRAIDGRPFRAEEGQRTNETISCAAGEGVWQAKDASSRRTASPAAQGGRGREERAFTTLSLAFELLPLPHKAAGVENN